MLTCLQAHSQLFIVNNYMLNIMIKINGHSVIIIMIANIFLYYQLKNQSPYKNNLWIKFNYRVIVSNLYIVDREIFGC